MINVMTGTMTPEQMAMQQHIAEALRAPQVQQMAQSHTGQAAPQSSAPGQMGQAVGDFASPVAKALGGYVGNNLGASMKYGTNPFSEQNRMLAAQDAAFL